MLTLPKINLRMKNLFFNIPIIVLFFCFQTKGQIITKIDTINNTPLTISIDKRANDFIENAENACIKNSKSNDNGNLTSTIAIPNRPLTVAEICRQTPKIRGYKIQLAVVKSNKEANEVKAYFRKKFPSIKTETDASLRPNYKVLAGSYFTKKSATPDLSKIKEFFKSAIAVEYRVYCSEAK